MKKNKESIIFTVAFFIILVVDTYAVVTNNRPLHTVFKPFLITTLALVYLVSVKKPKILYLSALFFCLLGDVLLMFEKHFVSGLISFLIAHILYIKLTFSFLSTIKVKEFIKSSIPFVLFFSFIIYLTMHNLNKMLIPVVVYGVVVSLFGTFTLINFLKEKTKENFLLLSGAILFIISDSFIALNRYYSYHLFFVISIIVLYAFAQYLICKSIIKKQSLIQ